VSLRLRLFATYATVVVVTLAVVALGMSVLLRSYADRLSDERLELTTRPIQVQVASLVRNDATQQELFNALQEQADNNNIYLLFADSSGNIIKQITPNQSDYISPRLGSLPIALAKAETGRFRTTDNRAFIFLAFPLTGQYAQSAGVDKLVLAMPRPNTLAVLASLAWPFVLAAGIALVVSLLISLWLGRTIYRPLAGVTAAAQKIAQGDYSQRVAEEGPQEVQQLAGSFNRMASEVEHSQTRLRQFVADVSHELKSPLTSIQGFAQALLDGTATDEITRTKAIRIIESESKRLKRQVDELLELSRVQSGQAKLAREPVDIADVLSRCLDIYSVQAKEKQVELHLYAEPGLTVTGDADRLEQVFNNLLDNAIKNSPEAAQVGVVSHKTDSLVQISVSDSGPGIPADQLPHVFERFYQVTGVRTGVGLGLAIAREIVLAHGGTMEASSPPGEGARFTVSLPLVETK